MPVATYSPLLAPPSMEELKGMEPGKIRVWNRTKLVGEGIEGIKQLTEMKAREITVKGEKKIGEKLRSYAEGVYITHFI